MILHLSDFAAIRAVTRRLSINKPLKANSFHETVFTLEKSAFTIVVLGAATGVKGHAPPAPGVCNYLNQPIIRHMKAIRYALSSFPSI